MLVILTMNLLWEGPGHGWVQNHRPGWWEWWQRGNSCKGSCDLETGSLQCQLCLGCSSCPCTDSKGNGEVGKEVNPSPGSDPTASKEFCLDDVWGCICTTQRITIPSLGTISIHGNTGIWGCCMQVHMLAEPAWGPQLPASVIPTATYRELHLGSSWVPICLRNLSAHPIEVPIKEIVGKVTPANQISSVVLPTEVLGPSTHGAQERMDPGGVEHPGPRGVAWSRTGTGQTAAAQREHLFSHSDLGLGKTSLIKHQIKLMDWTPFKVCYQHIPPNMYNDVKAHLQEMLDIGAIGKLHSLWASTVVLVQKKDGSLRFCIDLRKLNNWTIEDAYLLPCIDKTLDSLQGSSGSPHLTWSLGTGRLRWMRRASQWLYLP